MSEPSYPELDALAFFRSKLGNDLQIISQWKARNGHMLLLRDQLDTYLCILYVNGASWYVREGDFLRLPDIASHLMTMAGIPEFE